MRHWYDSNKAKRKTLERVLDCNWQVNIHHALEIMKNSGLEKRDTVKAAIAVTAVHNVIRLIKYVKNTVDIKANLSAFRHNWNIGTEDEFMLMDAMDIVMYLEKARDDYYEEN